MAPFSAPADITIAPKATRIKFKKEIKIYMSEENGTGNNLVWAVTTIIIVALIAGALYYSGFLSGAPRKQNVDVEVKVPSTTR